MLFNAGLETAFRAWVNRLTTEGFLLRPNLDRLSNVRYADDIMLFGKSIDEITRMVEILVEEFAIVGLELNASKTKIITNACPDFDFVSISRDMVEIIQEHSHHKYLGRYLSGETAFRGNIEVNHRIQCAWFKFGQHRDVLCNKNVSIQLRLKLFDATVTPTMLFGLAVLPLSKPSIS